MLILQDEMIQLSVVLPDLLAAFIYHIDLLGEDIKTRGIFWTSVDSNGDSLWGGRSCQLLGC